MTLLQSVFYNTQLRTRPGFKITSPQAWATPRQFYQMLEAYYLNNGLYDDVSRALFEVSTWQEAMKPLRNPAFRAVEFYVAHLWPGQLPDALPILADNEAIVEPIKQVWKWSNWTEKKQLGARWFANFGELFIKVTSRLPSDDVSGRVFLQLMDPRTVTGFTEDERGFLTYIRLDTSQMDAQGKPFTRTEVWSTLLYQVYEHPYDENTPLSKLGPPLVNRPISEFGIDFVPFVHARFFDIGDPRGVGCFTLALDKIDEGNRAATRLHQLLFKNNDVTTVVKSNSVDPTGRPLPAPRIGSSQSGNADSDTIEIGGNRVYRLPGNSSLEFLVPQLNYAAALAILQDHMQELERDMPELAYWRLREKGELSGKALSILLSDAEARVVEARGNGESALIRANQMALTLGKNAVLEGFDNVGEFDAGDFEHTFQKRDVFTLTEAEVYEIVQAKINAGIPLVTALKEAGWSDKRIADMLAEKEKEQAATQATLAAALVNAQRQFDQNLTSEDDVGEN